MAIKAAHFSYKFNQPTAATSWTINHNLNTQAPVVQVWYDNAGTVTTIEPASIQVVDANNITLTFSIAIAGNAIIF